MRIKRVATFVILTVLAMITLSGCARVNYTVEVKRNGKANISFRYSVADIEQNDIGENGEKEKYEKKGWEYQEYYEDDFKGFIINKKNVDLRDLAVIIEKETEEVDDDFIPNSFDTGTLSPGSTYQATWVGQTGTNGSLSFTYKDALSDTSDFEFKLR